MERAMEMLAAVLFTVMGPSHIFQRHAWVEFFQWVRASGRPGVFALAFLNLILGALMVAFHNHWSGLPLLVTLIGLAQVLKGAFYFLAPDAALRSLARVSAERFVAGGLVALVLAAVIWHSVLNP